MGFQPIKKAQPLGWAFLRFGGRNPLALTAEMGIDLPGPRVENQSGRIRLFPPPRDANGKKPARKRTPA
jgi:hypothetical protein